MVRLHTVVVVFCIVEWSRFENFAPLVGQRIINDTECSQYEITQLEPACDYYVRVSAGNIKGFGQPSSALIGIPSSTIWSFNLMSHFDDFRDFSQINHVFFNLCK